MRLIEEWRLRGRSTTSQLCSQLILNKLFSCAVIERSEHDQEFNKNTYWHILRGTFMWGWSNRWKIHRRYSCWTNTTYSRPTLFYIANGKHNATGGRHICIRKLQIYHWSHGDYSSISGSLYLLKNSQFQQSMPLIFNLCSSCTYIWMNLGFKLKVSKSKYSPTLMD